MSRILYFNESKQKTPIDKYTYVLCRVNGPANLQLLYGQSNV